MVSIVTITPVNKFLRLLRNKLMATLTQDLNIFHTRESQKTSTINIKNTQIKLMVSPNYS